MQEETIKSGKRLYLEAIRIIAAVAVIFIHISGQGRLLYTEYTVSSVSYWVYYMIAVFVCFAVPCFFMISGGLLLGRQESISAIWKKRVFPMMGILVFFSFIQYLWLVLVTKEEVFSLPYFFYRLYRNYWNYTYWYLYTYLAFLILLPLLQKAVSAFTKEHLQYLIGIGVFAEVIYPVGRLLIFKDETNMSPFFNIWIVGADLILFPMAGYYIETYINDRRTLKRLAVSSVAAIVLCLLISCGFSIYKYGFETGQVEVGEHFAVIYAAGVFLIFKYLFYGKTVGRVPQVILTALGRNIFAVYLTHILILDVLNRTPVLEFMRTVLHLNYMISAWIYCVIIMLVGVLLGEVWYHIRQSVFR